MKPTTKSCSAREKSISDYLGGGLDPRQRKELEEHLRTCPACREALERMEETGRQVRETVSSSETAAPAWDRSRERIKSNILAEITRTGRPRGPGILTRLRLRPIPALAAGILLLAAAGGIWRMAVLRPPREIIERGKAEGPAAVERRGEPGPRDLLTALAMMGKDISLFRGIQESFPQRVEWISIEGRSVDFDLSERMAEKDPESPQPLFFLAFKILQEKDDPETRLVSAPRIVVRGGVELTKDFPLSPEPGANYRLRVTPRMAAGNRIHLALELLFQQIGPDGTEEVRLAASSTLVPGEVTLLGSVLPGDEFYRVEVLSAVAGEVAGPTGDKLL